MKICYLCGEYPPVPHGGIGAVVQLMARALARGGHCVRVVGAGVGSPRVRVEMDEGVEVVRLPEARHPLGWLGDRIAVYRHVAQWARRGEVEVVEVPDWQGWAAGWPPLPVPIVTRLHGSLTYFALEMQRPVERQAFWLERASLRRSQFLSSTSRYTAEQSRRAFHLDGRPCRVIYNPVDCPSPPQDGRSTTEVVFSGTLTEKKGVVPLIQAWPRVVARFPEARLHVYGKDTSNPSLPSMKAKLQQMLPTQAASRVSFHGHAARSEVLAALGRARAGVFPSFAEAFAMAPLESMAAGCPTVYSRRGSGPELIRDGVDGLLIEPSEPHSIASALLRLLDDESLAHRLGRAGRERIDRDFSLASTMAQQVDFYRECVDRKCSSQ